MGLNNMCNLGEVIEREGITKGVVTSIQNLMENTGWPLERAKAALSVPKEEWSKYAEMLAEQ